MKLELGDIIDGKYCVESKIGQGGMATVWRCIHMDLDRPVAIKLLASGVGGEGAVERFLNEARVAASVRHRNVVDVLDFGTMTDGTPFMVMELLEGQTFADRLASERAIHVSAVISIVGQTLNGLGAVHGAGIVHRDIKPENVFLVRDDDGEFAKLLDFGISRAAADSNPTLRSVIPTLAGHLVGTPQYMSPEQARGLKRVDHRTDIYSTGVVLYEALTGELPFDSEFYGDVLVMITTQAPPLLAAKRPELGQPLSDVVERAMARDPDARFQSAREMRDAMMLAVDQIAAVSPRWVVANALPSRRRSPQPRTAGTLATIEQGSESASDERAMTLEQSSLATPESGPPAFEAAPRSSRSILLYAALAIAVLGIGGASIASVVLGEAAPPAAIRAPAAPVEPPAAPAIAPPPATTAVDRLVPEPLEEHEATEGVRPPHRSPRPRAMPPSRRARRVIGELDF
jgi:serine/threonine protein kinase